MASFDSEDGWSVQIKKLISLQFKIKVLRAPTIALVAELKKTKDQVKTQQFSTYDTNQGESQFWKWGT